MADLQHRPWPDRSLPPLDQVNHEPAEPTFRKLALFAGFWIRRLGRLDWYGQDELPQTGGLIVVANHTSHFDPICVGAYLIWGGRWPRYLGKVQLWKTPVIGWLARSTGQIPVDRGSSQAKDSLISAEEALGRGRCVAMYPEGTLTYDPDEWPMRGHTGAARLALTTGVPVIPVGQWGSQKFMPARKKGFPFIFRRSHVFSVKAGARVDLDDLRDQPLTKELLDEATERIMDAITALVADLRHETPPQGRWDPKLQQRVPVQTGMTDG